VKRLKLIYEYLISIIKYSARNELTYLACWLGEGGVTRIAEGLSCEKLARCPAVNPKRSVHDDYIVCLEDGKRFKSLKRHLMTLYDLTPDQYREKWGLDPSYPMVSPNYAAARSQLAKKMGLGRKRNAR
jgi:predicted transcriptional regulator